ncbi:dipeptidyl aminopeptidase/acylaminoacyl peptidase [Flavobacterium sp. PL11]|uniref:S9 family peptidase n=1 Tax=Flavobacterium sp. PL11 TaxID=3071717 RepID=UPI002E065875|nr:dipeptidyl aminopeptidase/acylaminoacyl peptidase [Flavobacterium sp. PL11]
MNKIIFTSLCVLISIVAKSQSLHLEEIMKGNTFIGEQPENQRWSLDGQKLYFDWNPNNELGSSTYYWKTGVSKPVLALSDEAAFSKLDFKKSLNPNLYYYIDKGRLFSYSLKTKTSKKLYQQSSPISSLQIGAEAGMLYFRQNENLFQYNTNEGSIIQITNFRRGKGEDNAKEQESFLKTQQKELFQFIRDQDTLKKYNLAKVKAVKSDFPKPYYYGKNNLGSVKVSPKGNYVTFRLIQEVERQSEKMPLFITADGYNQIENTKQKVSIDNLLVTTFGIYNVAKDSVITVNFSSLSHIQDVPKYFEQYQKSKSSEKKDKLIVVQEPIYNDSGSYAISEIRSQDNKDRWIVSFNLENATFQELDYQHDEAWIGGPGIPSNAYGRGILGFLSDNETIYFQSEATGYSHLYTYNLKSKKKAQLTKGNWEVRNVNLANDKKSFYLTTNTTHPGNRNFYKLEVSSGIMQPILVKDGAHEVSLSPDEKTLAIRYSYKNKPWEMYVAPNKLNSNLTQITTSTTQSFNSYAWRQPEVVTFKAQDGTDVHARMYQPETKNANKAAIIFVHGAGYLQNAHNYWSSYHREYMFHNLLTDLGYTVLDIDYRASDGYGRDFRTGIYRFMGGKDLTDQIDGKNYLVKNLGIDTNRVGIYGGSYGGFITLMGMLTAPKEFASGAALRSVTDWAHYNHGYTGNILNFPETDPDAYKKSSPIYFADNLQGNLLMLHGMVDDNVEYKDIVRMSQRFIELGKKNWSLSSFPVEAHGFKETYSWVDEYRRILDLFNSTLLKK